MKIITNTKILFLLVFAMFASVGYSANDEEVVKHPPLIPEGSPASSLYTEEEKSEEDSKSESKVLLPKYGEDHKVKLDSRGNKALISPKLPKYVQGQVIVSDYQGNRALVSNLDDTVVESFHNKVKNLGEKVKSEDLRKLTPDPQDMKDLAGLIEENVTGASAKDVKKALEQADVASIQPNYIYRLAEVPDDFWYEQQKHLESMNYDAAWDTLNPLIGNEDPAVVAVLDSGYMGPNTFPQMEEGCVLSPGKNVITGESNGNSTNNVHGTLVSYVINQATNNSYFYASVGRDKICVLPIVVVDDGYITSQAVMDAMAWILSEDNPHSVDVVNMSFYIDNTIDSGVQLAIDDLYNAGIVSVAAAGNDGGLANYYPACNDKVIGVGALNTWGTEVASFSNRSDCVDIMAIGQWVAHTGTKKSALNNVYEVTYNTSGTSISSPMVASGVALIGLMRPDYSVDDKINAIKNGFTSRVDGFKVFDLDEALQM